MTSHSVRPSSGVVLRSGSPERALQGGVKVSKTSANFARASGWNLDSVAVTQKVFRRRKCLKVRGIKVARSLSGGAPAWSPGLNGAGRSLEESCGCLSECTDLNLQLGCCNMSHGGLFLHIIILKQRRCFVSGPKKTQTQLSLLFLCASLSPVRTFSFSTHSLTHFVFSQPPFLCRGVVFRSPPATRGRPRWPTEGGRGRETERPLVAKDRLWFQEFVFTCSWEENLNADKANQLKT